MRLTMLRSLGTGLFIIGLSIALLAGIVGTSLLAAWIAGEYVLPFMAAHGLWSGPINKLCWC